jgi:MoxR-like ATPase
LTTPQTTRDKIGLLRADLNNILVERDEEILCGLTAIVGELHFFMIGSPGIAKSMLTRELTHRIDGFGPNDYFEWLMTRYTTPDELFGPMSLSALERDEFKRNPNHKLPLAKIAFLDEIWKANSANLNTLLKIVNEREWDNNGDDNKVPLSSLFSASNEMPQGDELAAMWDRIHFRFYVEPIKDGGNFITMLQRAAKRIALENVVPRVSWQEIEGAQLEVKAVEIPSDVLEALKSLRDALKEEGITPSDRRFVEALKVIKATAWMNGRDVADIDDMKLLQHVMWYDLTQQKIVKKAVLDLANPIDKESYEQLELLEGLSTELDAAVKNSQTQKELSRQAVEIHGKLQTVKARMEDLKGRAEESGRKSETLEQLKERFVTVARRLMTDAFGIQNNDD